MIGWIDRDQNAARNIAVIGCETFYNLKRPDAFTPKNKKGEAVAEEEVASDSDGSSVSTEVSRKDLAAGDVEEGRED